MNLKQFCNQTNTEKLVKKYAGKKSSFYEDSWLKNTLGILELGLPDGNIINYSTDGVHTINLLNSSSKDIEKGYKMIEEHGNDYFNYFEIFEDLNIDPLSNDISKVLVLDIKPGPAYKISTGKRNPTEEDIEAVGEQEEDIDNRQIVFDILAEREITGLDYSLFAMGYADRSNYYGISYYCGFTPRPSDFKGGATLEQLQKIYPKIYENK